MRQHEQTEVIRSQPVPVPQPADRTDDDLEQTRPYDLRHDDGADLPYDDDPTRADRSHDDDHDGVGLRHDDGVQRQHGDDRDGVDRHDRSAADDDLTQRPDFHEPAPVPTAFGATSVGGAVAASAMAAERPVNEHDPREEQTVRPGDGAQPEDRTGQPVTAAEAVPGDRHDRMDDDQHDTVSGDLDDPLGDDRDDVAGRHHTPTADHDDHDDRPGDTAQTGGAVAHSDDTTGTGLRPGAVSAEPAAMLFGPEVAEDFRGRWREVQLRFVDDPKAATGDAERLVSDAISALADALARQKDELGSWQSDGAEDTEQLRVAVRRYRDFLDRVLGR